jgi:RimJ/RimL family protein N-acetyltransferase
LKNQKNIFIGECGLSIEKINGKEYLELEYVLKKRYWHKGYAVEMASACKKFAFSTLNAETIYAIVHHGNIASQKVAERINMKIEDKIMVKNYYRKNVLHYVYSISNDAV